MLPPLCPEMFCRLSHDQDAGAHDEDRATKSSALTLMTEGFPAVNPQKPWESFDIEEWLHIGRSFGMVWVAEDRVVLGWRAGQWCQSVWRDLRLQRQLAWRRDPRTCSLLEIAGFLAHKWGLRVPNVRNVLRNPKNPKPKALATHSEAMPSVLQCNHLSACHVHKPAVVGLHPKPEPGRELRR